jgi:putative component of membrane protein insertase Oxa1/YidC/SpoIIIJ protein YidD
MVWPCLHNIKCEGSAPTENSTFGAFTPGKASLRHRRLIRCHGWCRRGADFTVGVRRCAVFIPVEADASL